MQVVKQPSDWAGLGPVMGPLIAGLVCFHVFALLIWIFFLVRGSPASKKTPGKAD